MLLNLKQKNLIQNKPILASIALLALFGFAETGCAKKNNLLAACPLTQPIATAGSEVGVMDPILGSDALAQSFKVTNKTTLDTLQLHLSVIGAVSTGQTMTLNIVADTNGTPDTAILSSGSLPIRNIIPGAAKFYSFSVSSIALLPKTTYWLVLSGSYPASSTDQVRWSSSFTSVDNYPDGFAVYKLGSGWTAGNLGPLRDFTFKLGSCSTTSL